jgi:hypothetical protein
MPCAVDRVAAALRRVADERLVDGVGLATGAFERGFGRMRREVDRRRSPVRMASAEHRASPRDSQVRRFARQRQSWPG